MRPLEHLKNKSLGFKILTLFLWLSIVALNLYMYYYPLMPFWANLLDNSSLVLIGFYPFYYVAYVLVPDLVYKQRFVRFTAWIISLVVAMTVLYLSISFFLEAIFSEKGVGGYFFSLAFDTVLIRFGIIFWTYIIPMLVATTFKIMSDRFRLRKKLLLIQKEKKSAELNYLQSQINPHFLFNVLNTIYFQISKDNVRGRNLVDLVSQVLRYQLYESKVDRIDIEKELKYISGYIKILEYSNPEIGIDARLDEDLKEFKIAPLLLRSLIEVCVRKDEAERENLTSRFDINLLKTGDYQFLASVTEYYTTSNDKLLTDSKESGILNLRRQLEILYPEKYILRRIDDTVAGVKTTTLVLDYGKN